MGEDGGSELEGYPESPKLLPRVAKDGGAVKWCPDMKMDGLGKGGMRRNLPCLDIPGYSVGRQRTVLTC